MKEEIFVNDAIDNSLKKYLAFKDNDNYMISMDFMIYTIEILTYIYGEADIINPYKICDLASVKVFNNNLIKYGLEHYKLFKFYQDMLNYNKVEKENNISKITQKNQFFSYIQEDLIEMFFAKFQYLKMERVELDNFKKLLFIPGSSNKTRNEYNSIKAYDEEYAKNYFEFKVYEMEHKISFTLLKKNVLASEIYQSFGIKAESVQKLNQKDLDEINTQILNYYKLNLIEPDLNKKLLNLILKNKPQLNLERKKSNLTVVVLIALSFLALVISGVLVGLKILGK